MDEHIGGILGHALRKDARRRLLGAVAPQAAGLVLETRDMIATQLDVQPGQVHVNTCGTRGFLDERLADNSVS